MPRETSEITKQDLDWKKLGEKIREIIKTPKQWQQFRDYIDFYFKKIP